MALSSLSNLKKYLPLRTEPEAEADVGGDQLNAQWLKRQASVDTLPQACDATPCRTCCRKPLARMLRRQIRPE